MKNLLFLIVGVFFGIVMAKLEVVFWFCIYEMFCFESFYMYGIIGIVVVLGVVFIWLMKKMKMIIFWGILVGYNFMNLNIKWYLFVGMIFGLGWVLVGCCFGFMYVLLGSGYIIMLLILVGVMLGIFIYGLVIKYLLY